MECGIDMHDCGILWDFSFLHRCCWRFHLCEVWHFVIGQVVCDVSKDPVAFFLNWLTLKVKVLWAFKTSAITRPAALCHVSEDWSLLMNSCDMKITKYWFAIECCTLHHAIRVFCCRGDKHILLYVSLYVMRQGIFLSLLMKQLFWISGQEIWPKCTKSCTACLWERAERSQHQLWWGVCWIYCPVLSPSCPRNKK
jgi:hypothetical protein